MGAGGNLGVDVGQHFHKVGNLDDVLLGEQTS